MTVMILPTCDMCTDARRVETYMVSTPRGEAWLTRCIECGQSAISDEAPKPVSVEIADEVADEAAEPTTDAEMDTEPAPSKPARGRKAKAESKEG